MEGHSERAVGTTYCKRNSLDVRKKIFPLDGASALEEVSQRDHHQISVLDIQNSPGQSLEEHDIAFELINFEQ